MKTTRFISALGLAMTAAMLGLLGGSVAATAQLQAPVITSIQSNRTNVIVTVRVPSGLRRITLETRERLGGRGWEPRSVARSDGTGGVVTFALAVSRQTEVMRVRGDASEPLPASFFGGTNEFVEAASTSSTDLTVGTYTTGIRDVNTITEPGGGATREVVESDIWKTRGQTLYFFNQYRGLQIIDISQPDATAVRGTLELPAAGEQMYLLGADHVVLLARDGCDYQQNQVLVVRDDHGTPVVVTRLPVQGSIQESRLVGTALYVASETYRPMSNMGGTTWEWGTVVSAFDLADPAAPIARDTLWYPGSGHAVAATDVFLFVVTQHPTNWWQSIVRVVDITAPDGAMQAYGSITAAGQVTDKFKLNQAGSVFTVISEDWRANGTNRLITKLETFRVPDPRSLGPLGIVKLGELALGGNERLRATRFDGQLVYVVTFFQIDPLWVVSLADPARPRIVGSVEVPGWSTYIEPLGDRLVTVGVENSRVAVSLFDVGDPAAPALLSRVFMGTNWSWSEANYNEKAFTVLPGAGLILIPFSGDRGSWESSAIQLVDLGRDALQARGQILGGFQFRRTMLRDDRILAISGRELTTVDASDRDHPLVTHRLALSWPADRVFLAGEYLIEVADSETSNDGAGPVLRVALAAEPNAILNQMVLGNLALLGVAHRDGRLFIAQGKLDRYYYYAPLADGSATDADSTVLLTVVRLDALPALNLEGTVSADIQSLGWSANWQAVWPRPGLLVWAGTESSYWRYYDILALPVTTGVADASLVRIWPPYWGGGGQRLVAFDVSTPAAPKFASEVNLSTNGWWSYGQAFAVDNLVYLSHQWVDYWVCPLPVIMTTEPAGAGTTSTSSSTGLWARRSYLDVVDFTDPFEPLVRKPVNIPGTLIGISHGGALLYTAGRHWTTNIVSAYVEFLDASAYDGVSASLVDSLPLPGQWPRPVLVSEARVYLGRPGVTASGSTTPNQLETWAISATGKFELLGRTSLTGAASVVVEFPDLLAVQQTDSAVSLFDRRDPAGLRRLGGGKMDGCLGYDLTRAAGDVQRGVWVPLSSFGVSYIPVVTR